MICHDVTCAGLGRIILFAAAFIVLGGCAGGARMALVEQVAPQQRRYPTEAERGEDLDILLVRQGSTIDLVNRTPSSYRDMQLWLNEQWVGRVDLAIGTDNRFDLNDFLDRHDRTYPVGGLLSPDRSLPLVHAELFDPETGLRHRITVQLPRRQPMRGTGGIQYNE